MALPRGHAASTKEFWYLTFFTNVIFCQGSRPTPNQSKETDELHDVSCIYRPFIWFKYSHECEWNLPNPSTSSVYWYTRSIHKYGRLPFSTLGYVEVSSTLIWHACFAASLKSAGRAVANGLLGSTKPAYMFTWLVSGLCENEHNNFQIPLLQVKYHRWSDLTSAALSKKNEATKRFFCPSPPPPFQTPPKVHFMWVHVDSLTLRAFKTVLRHPFKLEPDEEADAL